MNNAIMMMLPLILSGMKGQGNGLSPEMLLGLMGKSSFGAGNPMLSMMMSALNNENKPKSEKKTVNVDELFGADVATMLRIFTTMRANGESKV